MKCPRCHGTGRRKIFDGIGTEHQAICDWCDGAGEYRRTTEEWFVSLPTAEKADIMANLHITLNLDKYGAEGRKIVLEQWLKDVHE